MVKYQFEFGDRVVLRYETQDGRVIRGWVVATRRSDDPDPNNDKVAVELDADGSIRWLRANLVRHE